MDMVNKAVLIDYCDRYASTKKRGDSLCMEEKRKLVHSTELEVLLALAASAERVGTKELGKLCVDEIKKFLSVQNIWQIYKKNLESKYVALACEEVVMQYTKEFLSSPQLSAINPETVFHFLSLTKMDIANEAVPLDCCNNYAWKKEHWHSLCLEEQRELVHSSRLEVLIALATSAEQFGAEKLGKFCVDKLKNLLSVQNVWQIYNEHLKSKYVALACEEVFKRNTEEFLKSPHFFYIDPETLFHFLSLTRMDIANEDVLVDYCNSYAWWNRDWNSLLPNEKRKLVKITKFEALSALAASVERVGANELRKLCIDELKFNLSVHNIWQIYNKNLESEGVTLACEEMLMRNTEEFLKSPHFLEIDPETLSHFLSLKMLDIASEAVLIDYCDKYASTKKHGDSLFMFREYAIPYLRLLTLTEDEMNGPIKKYLEDFKWSSCLQEIKLGTSREPINSFAGEGLHMQARFCKVRIERTLDSEASCTLTIVPDELVANLKDTLLNDSISVPKTAKHNFALLFKPNRDILIKEFEFFLPLSIQRNSKNWCMEQMEHDFQTFSSSFHARIVVESTAKTCCTSFDLSKNMQDGLVTLRPSVDVKVDRFTDVRIEVIICGNSYLPDLGAIVDDCVEHKRKYVERNKVFVNCTSGKLQFQHYELDEESTVLREEKNTIFKSVLFDSITY
ncbi:uncharacterized protein LOC135946651 [Cloeon dipterum]|uniref:uncharacterized protein LOC135946651 n=1 Tax=Cloeon dipterum TaxID=197152 RepID=UPI00321FBA1A